MFLLGEDLHGLVLVRDSVRSDGSFMIGHVLNKIIEEDQRSLVVTLSGKTRPSLYLTSLRKFGLNGAGLLASGRLLFFDVLSDMNRGQLLDLSVIFKSIFQRINTLGSGRNGQYQTVYIIVDDLMWLKCSSNFENQWRPFLESLISLTKSRATNNALHNNNCVKCIIGLVHNDIIEDEIWIQKLEHEACTTVEVCPLETGVSSEVDGRVTVLRRRSPSNGRTYTLGATENLFQISNENSRLKLL